jgi:poly(ADP-ribose) glycohydrolase ARH3
VTPLESRLSAALLGLALGDALGAPFEGWDEVPEREVEAWFRADRPLRWTDDTHMAMALGRSLRDTAGRVDPQHLGDTFATAYRAEPWRGYGAGPPQIFRLAAGGTRYLDAAASIFGGGGSYGNGAAMRVAPVALAARGEVERAAALAAEQALVTHAHAEAVDGAVAVAAAVALLGSAPPGRAPTQVLAELPARMATRALEQGLRQVLEAADAGRPLQAARDLGTGLPAREAVPAAVAAFLSAPQDLRDTLVAAITLGGDTDTVAAMAGALAGAHLGQGALPPRLLDRLEARGELEALAADLLQIA